MARITDASFVDKFKSQMALPGNGVLGEDFSGPNFINFCDRFIDRDTLVSNETITGTIFKALLDKIDSVDDESPVCGLPVLSKIPTFDLSQECFVKMGDSYLHVTPSPAFPLGDKIKREESASIEEEDFFPTTFDADGKRIEKGVVYHKAFGYGTSKQSMSPLLVKSIDDNGIVQVEEGGFSEDKETRYTESIGLSRIVPLSDENNVPFDRGDKVFIRRDANRDYDGTPYEMRLLSDEIELTVVSQGVTHDTYGCKTAFGEIIEGLSFSILTHTKPKDSFSKVRGDAQNDPDDYCEQYGLCGLEGAVEEYNGQFGQRMAAHLVERTIALNKEEASLTF